MGPWPEPGGGSCQSSSFCCQPKSIDAKLGIESFAGACANAAGMRAAQSKDERAVFDTGGEIFLACRSCHMKYLLGYK